MNANEDKCTATRRDVAVLRVYKNHFSMCVIEERRRKINPALLSASYSKRCIRLTAHTLNLLPTKICIAIANRAQERARITIDRISSQHEHERMRNEEALQRRSVYQTNFHKDQIINHSNMSGLIYVCFEITPSFCR